MTPNGTLMLLFLYRSYSYLNKSQIFTDGVYYYRARLNLKRDNDLSLAVHYRHVWRTNEIDLVVSSIDRSK